MDGSAPVLTSISPDTAAANSATLSLTAYGAGFTPASELWWNGAPLPTIFVGDTELLGTVDGALLAAPGGAAVSVFTPGAGTSAALPFIIGNPVPILGSISPDHVTAGEPTFTLSAYGSDFVPGAEVRWNGAPLPTTFVNEGVLAADVDASLLLVSTFLPITVFNPAPAGGDSGAVLIAVAGPFISIVSPGAIPIQPPASPAITITVFGYFYNPWSVVYANGIALPTTYIGIAYLNAELDPNLLAQASVPGAIGITVVNTVEAVSNVFGVVVDSGNNAGLIRTHPVAPAPAEAFALWTEIFLPFAPLTFVVDAGNPVPFNAWPDPVANLVLGVTELAGSNGLWLPLVDGIGLFGPPDGAACDASGHFILPGFTMPDPPAGLGFTLQAVYLDPASALGFNLTFPLHTLGL